MPSERRPGPKKIVRGETSLCRHCCCCFMALRCCVGVVPIVAIAVGAIAIASMSLSLTSLVQLVGAFTVPHRKLCRLAQSMQHHGPTWKSRVLCAIPDEYDEQRQYWTLPRLYVGQSRNMQSKHIFSTGANIPLLPDQAHYLIKVMRIMNNGRTNRRQPRSSDDDGDNEAMIRIFNGIDGEWLAKVHVLANQKGDHSSDSKTRRKKGVRSANGRREDDSLVAECIIQLRVQDYGEDERPWILFVPLKKQPRMKLMIEKCTELGVGKMIPVASDRMEGEALTSLLGTRGDDVFQENNDSRIDKLELQAIEASEQCERLGIPTITCDIGFSLDDKSSLGLLTVRDVLDQWCRAEVKKSSDQNDPFSFTTNISMRRVLLICRERGNGDDAVPVLQALLRNERVSFLVGPEGGWSADEEELFDDVCSKFADQNASPVRCVSLGSSVLRAETACLMAVGAWALTERQ